MGHPLHSIHAWCMLTVLISSAMCRPPVSKHNRLLNSLLRNYSSMAVQSPPVGESELPLAVKVDIRLLQLEALDSKENLMSSQITLIQTWNDSYISWDPVRFAGVDHIRVPPKKLWKPSTRISNLKSPNQELSSSLEVTNMGTVTWSLTSSVKTHCVFDMEYFPNDAQACEIKLVTSEYADEIALGINKAGNELQDFYRSGAWSILEISPRSMAIYRSDIEERITKIVYTVKLARKAGRYMYSIVIPVAIVIALSLLVFLVDRKEKFTVGLLLCLAMFGLVPWVFQQGALADVGKSIFGRFIVLTATLYAVVLLVYAAILTLCSKESPVPGCIKLMFKYLAIPVCAGDLCPCIKPAGDSENAAAQSEDKAKPISETNLTSNRKEWKLVAKTLARYLCAVYILILFIIAPYQINKISWY